MSLNFDRPNHPNPARTLESLRYLGYGNYEAVADLADNSLDANADEIAITIGQKSGEFVLTIADNGIGMDEATLDEATRLGSMTDRNPSSDLGRYGMGLVTASLSMARRTHVITKHEGSYSSSVTDLDEVVERNEFCKHLAAATDDEIAMYHDLRGGAESGTVVVLSKCDNLKNKNTTQFAGILRKHLGRIHRYFLQAGRQMWVNGESVRAIDPLELADPRTELFCDEVYPIEVILGDERVAESMRVRIVLIPDDPSAGERDIDKSLRAQGFYVMRNQREIVDAVTLDLFSKHNDFNRMRGEIFFPGTLDKCVGIEFTKRDVKLDQSLMDRLQQYVKPQCSTIKAREAKRGIVQDGGQQHLFHEQAAKAITEKDNLLLKPKGVIERRQAHEKQLRDKGQTATGAGSKRVNLRKTQETDRLNCKFVEQDLGAGGQIFETDMEGRTVIVRWNIAHPFYRRFVADNKSNGRLVTAVDFLVYSMAVAELGVVNDDERQVATNIKTVVSGNLRTLLG